MLQFFLTSAHPDFKGKRFREYEIKGERVIGAFGDEEFQIQIVNDGKRREIVISVDGVNVLSGEKASLEERRYRFIVGPNEQPILKAWPETTAGGRKFAFVSAKNAVVAHTIQDESQRGIIAIATFTEGYVTPEPVFRSRGGLQSFGATRGGGSDTNKGGYGGLLGGSGVGAGGYAEQRIGTAAGLREPVYESSVRIRHMWWDELLEALKAHGTQPPAPMAPPPGFFPPAPLANLGSTPSIGRATEEYPRFI